MIWPKILPFHPFTPPPLHPFIFIASTEKEILIMMEQPRWALSPDGATGEELFTTSTRIQRLESRLAQLESQIPNSSLISPKFWRRAFAVFGHQFCAVMAIYGILLVIAVVIGIVLAIFGALMNGRF
jgi:hypothetical protein